MAYSDGPRGWLFGQVWRFMVAEALTSLVMSWPTFMRALKLPKSFDSGASSGGQHIPNSWWMGGLMAGGTLTAVIASAIFNIPVWMTIIAIVLSAVLSIVAVRSVGETDINPVGGMGKVTQLAYGGPRSWTDEHQPHGRSHYRCRGLVAGDMMQDLKLDIFWAHLLASSSSLSSSGFARA